MIAQVYASFIKHRGAAGPHEPSVEGFQEKGEAWRHRRMYGFGSGWRGGKTLAVPSKDALATHGMFQYNLGVGSRGEVSWYGHRELLLQARIARMGKLTESSKLRLGRLIGPSWLANISSAAKDPTTVLAKEDFARLTNAVNWGRFTGFNPIALSPGAGIFTQWLESIHSIQMENQDSPFFAKEVNKALDLKRAIYQGRRAELLRGDPLLKSKPGWVNRILAPLKAKEDAKNIMKYYKDVPLENIELERVAYSNQASYREFLDRAEAAGITTTRQAQYSAEMYRDYALAHPEFREGHRAMFAEARVRYDPAFEIKAGQVRKAASSFMTKSVIPPGAIGVETFGREAGGLGNIGKAINEIEGLAHGGLAQVLRRIFTHFGSGWRGIISNPSLINIVGWGGGGVANTSVLGYSLSGVSSMAKMSFGMSMQSLHLTGKEGRLLDDYLIPYDWKELSRYAKDWVQGFGYRARTGFLPIEILPSSWLTKDFIRHERIHALDIRYGSMLHLSKPARVIERERKAIGGFKNAIRKLLVESRETSLDAEATVKMYSRIYKSYNPLVHISMRRKETLAFGYMTDESFFSRMKNEGLRIPQELRPLRKAAKTAAAEAKAAATEMASVSTRTIPFKSGFIRSIVNGARRMSKAL